LFFLRCRRQQRTKQACRHLLHLSKKIGVKNKQIKKKVDVHLLATNALVFLEECFLQHHFSNVFCNTISAPLLQHCFNTPMQHCLL
jgi:G:T-mismatch repair DNA endonuclease (very short patch repair protein)